VQRRPVLAAIGRRRASNILHGAVGEHKRVVTPLADRGEDIAEREPVPGHAPRGFGDADRA
jgi:hypothetical protein